MIARVLAAGLAALCLALAAPAARAEEPAGDWVGTLHMPRRDYQVGLRVRHDATGDHVTYDWLDLDIRDVRLDRVEGAPGPVFHRVARQGTFTARWDTAHGWRGEWLREGRPYAMSFQRAVLPPTPLISRADKVFLPIVGLVALAEAIAIARLLQLRRRRRQRQRVA